MEAIVYKEEVDMLYIETIHRGTTHKVCWLGQDRHSDIPSKYPFVFTSSSKQLKRLERKR